MIQSVTCAKCGKKILSGSLYQFKGEKICEDCHMEVHSTRNRKPHWQYIKSVKTDYIVPGRKAKT
jgi:hypothetical protein